MKKFTTIIGLSDSRRIPRIDKIRLGAKIQKAGSNTEYPVELPFFLLPESVATIHGNSVENPVERAKELGLKNKAALEFVKNNNHRLAEELPVMIPVEDAESSFPQSYKLYGGFGLKCRGNGKEASERIGVTNEWKEKSCPCNQLKSDKNPKGGCSISANLSVILPQVDIGGVYQVDIGSVNSIIDINSGIDYAKSIFGRVAMIPLVLRRVATETHHAGKKAIHWTVQLKPVGNIHAIAEMRESQNILTHNQVMLLEEPVLTDPKLDEVDAIYEQPEHITKMITELNEFRTKKKLTRDLVERTRKAIEENNDEDVEEIHAEALAGIMTGSSAEDVTRKLDKKKEEKTVSADGKKDDTRQSSGKETGQTVSQSEKDRF